MLQYIYIQGFTYIKTLIVIQGDLPKRKASAKVADNNKD